MSQGVRHERGAGVNMLDMIHESARRGTLLSSCEPEFKEVMRQIDVYISTRKIEQEEKVLRVKDQLQVRERELSTLRVALQERAQKTEGLKEELSKAEHQMRARTSDYETQLLRLRSELTRLKKNYEKLKSKKATSGRESELKELCNEVMTLHHQAQMKDDNMAALSRDLTLSRAELSALRDQYSSLEQELSLCHAGLREKDSSGAKASTKIDQLYSQLSQAEQLLASQEKKIRNLKVELEERRSHAQASLAECHSLHEQLKASQQSHKEAQSKFSQQETLLKRKEKQLQTAESDRTALSQQLEELQKTVNHQEKLIRSYEQQHGVKVEGEVARLHHQVRLLQDKLQQQLSHEKSLREDNDQLRRRNEMLRENMQKKGAILTNQEIQSRLEMKENELQGVESKLFVKERRVHELEERVSHLEQQLRDVTLQLDSSETKLEVASQQISSLSAENTSLRDQTSSYSPQLHCSTGSRENSTIATLHKISPTPASNEKPAVSRTTSLVDSRVTAQSRMKEARDQQGQEDDIVEAFRRSLDTVMDEHFSKLDQSLQLLLQPVPTGTRQ